MKFIAIIALLMVFILADFMVFNHGINSFFWQYKTPIELEFQKQILEERSQYESAWVSSMDAYDESQMQAFVDADRAARAPADSVLEDETLRQRLLTLVVERHQHALNLAKAEKLLKALVNHVEMNTCSHEETHRGGAIWEICNGCGAKWADDEGGKPKFKWPKAVAEAMQFLEKKEG